MSISLTKGFFFRFGNFIGRIAAATISTDHVSSSQFIGKRNPQENSFAAALDIFFVMT
jgi:hypothetical protein